MHRDSQSNTACATSPSTVDKGFSKGLSCSGGTGSIIIWGDHQKMVGRGAREECGRGRTQDYSGEGPLGSLVNSLSQILQT